MASLHEIMSTQITTRIVSREAGANHYLLQLFGMQPGGRAERQVGKRQFGYDVFNDTRTTAQGRMPGVAAGTATRQVVGRVQGVFPRFNEKLTLLAEELYQFRVLGGPSSVYDQRGVQYTLRQQRYMGQRLGNSRMTMLAGLIRGGILYAHRTGDQVYYDFTSASNSWSIDWLMPAANKTQLNMTGGGNLITGTWLTPTNDIPSMLNNINAAFQQVVGTTLGTIICPINVWQAVINNDFVMMLAGTSNPPFTVMERLIGTSDNGLPQTVIIARIAAVPWIDWIITDEGLKLGAMGSETFTKFVPDNYCWMGPSLRGDITNYFELLLGSEPINEGYGSGETERYGVHAWTKETDDPAGRMLYTVDNSIPANYVPATNCFAQVIF